MKFEVDCASQTAWNVSFILHRLYQSYSAVIEFISGIFALWGNSFYIWYMVIYTCIYDIYNCASKPPFILFGWKKKHS